MAHNARPSIDGIAADVTQPTIATVSPKLVTLPMHLPALKFPSTLSTPLANPDIVPSLRTPAVYQEDRFPTKKSKKRAMADEAIGPASQKVRKLLHDRSILDHHIKETYEDTVSKLEQSLKEMTDTHNNLKVDYTHAQMELAEAKHDLQVANQAKTTAEALCIPNEKKIETLQKERDQIQEELKHAHQAIKAYQQKEPDAALWQSRFVNLRDRLSHLYAETSLLKDT